MAALPAVIVSFSHPGRCRNDAAFAGDGRQAQPSIREATVYTQTHPTTDRRFVDLEELICPGCGEQVRCAPPDGHVVDGLPVPQFSHPDATALCRTRSGAVAEPVEEAW